MIRSDGDNEEGWDWPVGRWENEGGAFTREELRLISAALAPVRVPEARTIRQKIDRMLGQRESGPGGGGV